MSSNVRDDTRSQPKEPAPAEAAEELALRLLDVRMTAQRVVKRSGDDQSLAYIWPRAEHGA